MRSTSRMYIGQILLSVAVSAIAQRSATTTSPIHDVVQPVLIQAGNSPFHIQAVITTGKEHSPYAKVEMFWMAPDKFRRTIQATDFSQTLIVNGPEVYEQDAPDYFPLDLRTLVTAMVDPRPILDAIKPGDSVLTKANGQANPSGLTCFGPKQNRCFKDPNGFHETVAASGHSVAFSRYERFKGKEVARVLTNAPRLGEDLLTLEVTDLQQMTTPDSSLFTVPQATPKQQRLQFTTLAEPDLRKQITGMQQIIWPQPLDGAEHGPASFYVSVDRSGKVREVKQLYTANERTNDSAKSQISRWHFTPIMQDGAPAQADGILSFTLDTRAWGPKLPLTDAEARKLASNIVEPAIPAGNYPAGTIYTLWAAVDSDGRVIEVMTGDGPHELFKPCYDALRKWQFAPLMQEGEPRPYRANIIFHVN